MMGAKIGGYFLNMNKSFVRISTR